MMVEEGVVTDQSVEGGDPNAPPVTPGEERTIEVPGAEVGVAELSAAERRQVGAGPTSDEMDEPHEVQAFVDKLSPAQRQLFAQSLGFRAAPAEPPQGAGVVTAQVVDKPAAKVGAVTYVLNAGGDYKTYRVADLDEDGKFERVRIARVVVREDNTLALYELTAQEPAVTNAQEIARLRERLDALGGG